MGITHWRGRREFHDALSFCVNFWIGRRMFCLSHNCG